MAVLTDQEIDKIWRGFMRYLSSIAVNDTVSNVVKQDIRDAIEETDLWIDTNQGGFNAALPVAFRNNATQSQKALMFCAVTLMRYDEQLLRQIFAEVD